MMDAFGSAILELAREKKDIVCVAADTVKTMSLAGMQQEFPQRVINVGIAEQNMMMVAAGLAAAGKTVFVASYAVFTCMRALEEARTFIAYPELNVKICGGLGGLSAGQEGPTHQAIEDIGIMRSIPKMGVVVPSDAVSVKSIVRAAAEYHGPVYIRLSKAAVPVIYDADYRFELGRSYEVFNSGNDATIFVTGVLLSRALEAATVLQKERIGVRVVDMPSLKPLDQEAVIRAAKETGAIVTVEEHNIFGGLGSAVAETLVETIPVPMQRVGILDTYGDSAAWDELLDHYGLTVERIVKATKDVISRKK